MIKILFLIKAGKRTKFSKTEFYGEEALLCEIKPNKVKYAKILRKARKYSPFLMLINEETAKYTDFKKLEKYTCYTPAEMIYDNFDKISERFFRLYGCGKEKINYGVFSEELSFLNKLEGFGDYLKCVYVFGCEKGHQKADEFFKKTGVNVVFRPANQVIPCDLFVRLSGKILPAIYEKPVADFSDFKDFERECEEIGKILVKYLLNLLKKT